MPAFGPRRAIPSWWERPQMRRRARRAFSFMGIMMCSPSIRSIYGTRRPVYEEVTVTCADRDLHSGLFGGAAQNPLRVLAGILGAMHDENGRVTIPTFYEGVKELPPEIRRDLADLHLTPEEFLGDFG